MKTAITVIISLILAISTFELCVSLFPDMDVRQVKMISTSILIISVWLVFIGYGLYLKRKKDKK